MFIAPFFAVLEVLEILFDFEKERTTEYKLIAEADIAYYRIQRGYQLQDRVKIKKID